jgi:hypothetical protein
MRNYFKQSIITLCLITIVFPASYFSPLIEAVKAEESENQFFTDEENQDLADGEDSGYMPWENGDNPVGGEETEDPDDLTAPDDIQVPDPIRNLQDSFIKNFPEISGTQSEYGLLSTVESVSDNPRLVLNPSDKQDLRIMYCLGSVIPDYANNPDSLAVATGNALKYILDLQHDQPEKYRELVGKAQEGARQQIVSRLKTDVANFACIAGVDQVMAAEMLQYQQEEVDAIIEYAKNKIVIDRRILQLLVNLVTPKDQGGAGHERIKVHRIRNGYDRDARMFSRESDATYQQLAEQKEGQAPETVGDTMTANRSELAKNHEFSNAEALAAVIDSAGRNQGDLIFSDKEDEQNISAHWRGQAIDISEVDNIKFTLIKKKRLGSDKKVKQPATPIRLAWQTSEGYDASPPPDWSSLNTNLRGLATSQYLDLLDEFGIDANYGEDLSDANFSDIVGLIGNSLIGEILNSPGNSLSGYSLADTAKKIGALVLADMFDLPREALLDSDLLDLHDLEENIGEAIFESKLNLPYGSIRGENLYKILVNVGIQRIEKEMNVPSGTIQPGMDARTLQLTIGRRVIEEELYLQKEIFQSDTTYSRLKDVAGERKIEMIFSTPSMVDERLGIDFGISENYKNGGKSPDAYAILVGAKRLQDSVYLYGTAGGTGNALGLSINLQTAVPDTATAGQRFTDITSGNTSEDFYKNLGIEYLAQRLTVSSEARVAIMQWLQANSLSSQTNCAIHGEIKLTIPKPGSTTGETVDVTIPEDQMMTSFGLRRGDFARLFGCYSVQPKAVFRALGEKALWNAVRNSSLTEQAQARFLAEHPEISNFLRSLDFYVSRFETIKTTTDKIKNDWDNFSGSESIIPEIRELISGSGGLSETVARIDNNNLSLSNLSAEMRKLKQVPVIAGKIYYLIGEAQLSDNQTLRDRANTTLLDVTTVIHSIDEVISGEEQPDITTLQIGEISITGNASSRGQNTSGVGINRATMVLMLSGRLSPKDFLISIGSNRVENALGLPTNSILYFAKFLLQEEHDKNDLKGAFFRSVGQAQIEETFTMPPFFFQAEYPGKKGLLTDIKNNIANSFNISEAEAGAKIMRSLNLPGSFSSIEHSRILGLSQVAAAANKADEKLRIKTGTTADFLNGQPINKEEVSNTETKIIAGRLGISEKIIDKFVRVKNGDEGLARAKEDKYSDISYNGHNPYAEKPAENANQIRLAGQCPMHFNFEVHDGKNFSISAYIEDNSYVYTDADGPHSFSSLDAARKYMDANQNKQVDFVKALSNSLAQNPNTGLVDEEKSNNNVNKIENFLSNKNEFKTFSDDELEFIRDRYHIPLKIINGMTSRGELLDLQGGGKSYSAYLEHVGKKTAERRIVSTLLGSFSITLAGDQIDATDIFDLLNGNGMQVAYRIGARYLERHFDVSPNLISRIIEAPNEVLRNCSLAEIGGNLLGSVFGLKNISLSGNIYENIGGAKIEEALNLPARSFRGVNLNELITNVGAINFARAFQLPPGEILSQKTITNIVGSDQAAVIGEYEISRQYQMIEQLIDYPEAVTDRGSTHAALTVRVAEQEITGYVNKLPQNTGTIEGGGTISTVTDYQRQRFQSRMTEIDGMLGLSQGTTKGLLTNQITPDNYRRKATEKVLERVLATNFLEAFGLGDEYAGYVNARNIYNMIKSCQNSSTCDRVGIYNNFSTLFGINLDAKLGLPDGTIAGIIADPKRATAELITSALARFDQQLGLVDGQGRPIQNGSFTSAYYTLYGNNGSDYRNCEADSTNCLRTKQNENTTVTAGLIPTSVNRWSYVGSQIGAQLAGNYLNEIGILRAPPGQPDTVAIIRGDAHMLLSGDLRVLGITAAIAAAEPLHIYGEGGNDPNLPAAFRISYEDIRYAVLGSPAYEESIVQAARNNFLTEYQAGNTQLPSYLTPATEEAEMAGSATDPMYGTVCPLGTTSTSCIPKDQVDSMGPGMFHYSTSEHLGTMTAEFSKQYPSDDQAALDATMRLVNDQNGQEQLRRVEEAARNEARRQLRNNLMYRMADAKLYQLDKNIPPGFTATMFEGNGVQKTMMIKSYVENTIKNLEIDGVSIDQLGDMLNIVNEARSFFSDPQNYNLDLLVVDGRMARLDSWLSEEFGDFFGFDLQPGTFTAIFYGLKTGNFTQDITIAGAGGQSMTISSIKTIYTNWATEKVTAFADKALGLPPGTAFQTYTMYKNLTAARTATMTATNALTGAEMALEAARHTGDLAAIENAQNNFSAAENSLNQANTNITTLKAELISFVVSIVFSKQITAAESALGLVPGTGAILVGVGVSYLMGAAINPWAVAAFVLVNLFGIYKVELRCTADGYYPSTDESPSDPAIYDNPEMGVFDGFNNKKKKEYFVKAAQYKARTLAGDALMLAERIDDELAIPSQIMVGRQEDADYWQYKIDEVICSKIGGCAGTRAGMWKNPQTTFYTHIGF